MAASDGATLSFYGGPSPSLRLWEENHKMIAYVTVGADDIAKAERFYSAFLPALGYALEEYQGDLSYILPTEQGQPPVQPDFYVKSPFNGQSASAGNGVMVAFQARSQSQVSELHGAALAAGGSDDGQPGFRPIYGPHFYVGYLRDPHGNKIALFSSDPNEPGRDDRRGS
ncbi:hypothetical protein SSE37_08153 [Sagittula stellata E-37]|uniref:VOC domain-containing protein n=2 Tax=Sagittula stellata TaxID=52603 RepID=A3JZ62_SAGS3|nr:hypothetical protein SSE37_08153 [Sagittula stellata E-37]